VLELFAAEVLPELAAVAAEVDVAKTARLAEPAAAAMARRRPPPPPGDDTAVTALPQA